jgi:4-diphosphocytidyl-2-C-methyl-D-erythritol kinase
LVIEPAPAMSLAVDGPFAAGVPTDATNLVWRAADAVGVTRAIHVHKGIPHGAGLGGGSADAAAVLVAVDAPDVDVAAKLGADVPFCLRGGAARMRGVGDVLEPADLPPLAVVIVTPPFGCATAAVYAAWDALGGPAGRTVDTGIRDLPTLVNDLEPAALYVEPRLATVRDAIERTAGVAPILAGSGSSYAVLFARDDAAARAGRRLEATGEGAVFVGRTTDVGVAVAP